MMALESVQTFVPLAQLASHVVGCELNDGTKLVDGFNDGTKLVDGSNDGNELVEGFNDGSNDGAELVEGFNDGTELTLGELDGNPKQVLRQRRDRKGNQVIKTYDQ